MHVQVIEPYIGGHHSNYLEALLPAFVDCLQSGQLSRVTITITQEHFEHLQKGFLLELGELARRVTFDATFPSISPAPTFLDRFALFRAMNRAVEHANPDHLIVPSADYDVMVQAMLYPFVRFGQNTKVKAIGILHYGMPLNLSKSAKETIKQRVYQLAWRFSRWNTLMMVNPLMYENVDKKEVGNKLLQVLPDPVPAALDISTQNARAYFNLPNDATILGAVGVMDSRKAVPELLEAFSAISVQLKDVKLALIGQLAEPYEALINEQYAHLVEENALIIVNRYLTQHEVQVAYAAMDVLLVMQYRRANLSANLLKAMMYDKPIVADDFGYTGMMLARFALGHACKVAEPESIQAAMLSAVQAKDAYVPTQQTARLKEFHAPQNFAKVLLNDVLGDQANFSVKTWGWVCGLNSAPD